LITSRVHTFHTQHPELIFFNCHQNTLRNFILQMNFSEHRILQLDHADRSIPAHTGARSYPPDEGDTISLAQSCDYSTCESPASRKDVEPSLHLCGEHHTAPCQAVVMTMKSTHRVPLPLLTPTDVTRSQGGCIDSMVAGINYHQWGPDVICTSYGRPTTGSLKKAKQLHVSMMQGMRSYYRL